jgi:hypothetical protein
MTTELQKLQLNLKVADKMVSQLSLLDGAGYDRMGEYAQNFLTDIADKGEIRTSYLAGYSQSFREILDAVQWINPVSEQKARDWISLVASYRCNRSVEMAQALIAF